MSLRHSIGHIVRREKGCFRGSLCSAQARALIGLFLGLVLSCSVHSSARAGGVLQLFADPATLRADGRSTSIIIAQVQDVSGSPAPDGTSVSFSTSLGSISPVSQTQGGVARAVLTSGSSAGTAIVSAMVAGSRQEIEVEFSAQGGETEGATAILRLAGEEVAYSQTAGLASASGGGRFEYGSISIRAEAIQCDINSSELAAQGNVEISDGEREIRGDAIIFAPRQGQGSLLRYEEDEAVVYTFHAPGLQMTREEEVDLEEFRPFYREVGRTLIITKQAQVLPDGETVFDEAAILMDGVKLISLPHYAITAGNGGSRQFVEQALIVDGGDGLSADFPYYYIAKPGRIGSIRLTHNMAQSGMGESDWGLGLEERYLLGDKGRGKLNIDDPLNMNKSRGLRWTHSHEFSPRLRTFSSFRYTRFDADSPRTIEASTTISKIMPKMSVDLALNASDYADSENYSAVLSAHTRSRPIGKSGFSYSNSARINYALRTASDLIAYSPEEGTTEIIESGKLASLTESISMNLHCPQGKIGQKATFDSGLKLSNSWGKSGTTQTLSITASLRRKIGEQRGALGINYTGSLSSGKSASGDRRQQTLSCNFNVNKPGEWRTTAFASYNVERNSIFGSGTLVYYLPFQRTDMGRPQWSFGLSGSYSEWMSQRSMNIKTTLARDIGNWAVSLNYAPKGSIFATTGLFTGSAGLMGMSGYGFTQELGRTLWIEINPGAF